MPRSIVSKAQKKYIDTIKKEYEKLKKAQEQALDMTINEAYELTYKDVTTIFDTCIDQFYSYKTRSYYRYETGIGTGTGSRLYYANQITKDDKKKCISVKWDGEDINSEKPYKDADANTIVDQVMRGIRFFREDAESNYIKRWRLRGKIKTSLETINVSRRTPNTTFLQYKDIWSKHMKTRIPDRFKRYTKMIKKNMR